jgi:hypothetical protein
MKPLHPLAKGPFELLVHAEEHLINGDDFDRRIALISFDNAVEVAITTYLTLNPMYRNGRSYNKVSVEEWLKNYHSKLDFLDAELAKRSLTWHVDRNHIIWCHDHRNEQYHGGRKGTPELDVLNLMKKGRPVGLFDTVRSRGYRAASGDRDREALYVDIAAK